MASMAPRDLPGGKKPSEVSDSEWKTLLTDEQFRILRMKGTEYPGTGEYNKFYPKDGVFCCAGCHAPLYKSETKFDSGTTQCRRPERRARPAPPPDTPTTSPLENEGVS